MNLCHKANLENHLVALNFSSVGMLSYLNWRWHCLFHQLLEEEEQELSQALESLQLTAILHGT